MLYASAKEELMLDMFGWIIALVAALGLAVMLVIVWSRQRLLRRSSRVLRRPDDRQSA
jgi:choline-glycine betaine transporter